MAHEVPQAAVIAVDGGGTRCRLVLDGPERRVSVHRGPANVATQFDAALAEIVAGLEDLAAAAGTTPARLHALPAYLGLAGATDRRICDRVAAALPLDRVRVEEDRAAVLRGALGRADGAVAHCGTGSFFAVRRNGATRFAGGWGARLGDEASSYWIGREALAAALTVVDGMRPASPLSEAFLARWSTPAGLVAFVAAAAPDEIGMLAPEVVTAAASGDPLGLDVMRRGAAHLTRMLDQLGWQPDLAICPTGGVAQAYAPYLPAPMRDALAAPAGAPIDGAVALARDFAAETPPASAAPAQR